MPVGQGLRDHDKLTFPIGRGPSRKVYGEFYGQPQGAERPTAPPRRQRGMLVGDSWRPPSSEQATGNVTRVPRMTGYPPPAAGSVFLPEHTAFTPQPSTVF